MPRTVEIIERAPIRTWFGVGGQADELARPADEQELLACVGTAQPIRVLGEGANLLVDDGGVDGLVVRLDGDRWKRIEIDADRGVVCAGAGADLRRVIVAAIRAGLGGIEGLGGIPASMGGAVRMNAGGRFGELSDRVVSLHLCDADRGIFSISRDEAGFGYRSSGLERAVVVGVELALDPGQEPAALRERYKQVLAGKGVSQPMGERSAGCAFKNPVLREALPGVGEPGTRVPAGLLIDRAGCKGLAVGGASVSERHANFIVTSRGTRARDVIELMDLVATRVSDAFGVRLEREVVVWSRTP